MPSLVATTSALARKPCVSTHYVHTKDFFWGGGSLTPFLFGTNLLVRVKLGYLPNFNFLGKPLLKKSTWKERKKNIEFARGGAHLPIAHALRLPKTEIISWRRDFFGGGEFWISFLSLIVRVKLGYPRISTS